MALTKTGTSGLEWQSCIFFTTLTCISKISGSSREKGLADGWQRFVPFWWVLAWSASQMTVASTHYYCPHLRRSLRKYTTRLSQVSTRPVANLWSELGFIQGHSTTAIVISISTAAGLALPSIRIIKLNSVPSALTLCCVNGRFVKSHEMCWQACSIQRDMVNVNMCIESVI